MAEYFYTQEDAEAYLRRTHQRVALYARIQLNGAQQWMVDHQDRNRGSLMKVMEDLTSMVTRIRQG
jgi:hypothetical protein